MMNATRFVILAACMAIAVMAAPRFARSPLPARTPPTPAPTTRPPTAVDICAGDNLSAQLQLVCAQLETQKAEKERLDRAKAEASCIEIIQPELKQICIQLEMNKLTTGAATVTARTRPTTRPTTPRPTPATAKVTGPTTTQAPAKVTGSSRLIDLFGNLFGAEAGSIDIDQISTDLGQRAKETFDSFVEGTPMEGIDLGEVASNLNEGGLSEVFGRLSADSGLSAVRPILSDAELSRPQKANMIKDFLEQRGFDIGSLGLGNRDLLSTFSKLVNQQQMSDSLISGGSGITALLSDSTAGSQMANWAQQLVKIWQANSQGLMKLPRPDLASILEQGQALLKPAPTPVDVDSDEQSEIATNAGSGNALGVPPSAQALLGDAPVLGRINPTALDSLITEEVKNQALANVFANVSKGLFNVGK